MPHLTDSVSSPPFIFVSGRLPLGANGQCESGDVAQQTEQCLAALERALEPHGLGRRHVVKTTVWITKRGDFAAFDRCYATFFGDHKPARSTVVCELVVPGCLIEIEAIAKAGG
jgi:2-iminobutanoate/2-iminopropanoate deaminase